MMHALQDNGLLVWRLGWVHQVRKLLPGCSQQNLLCSGPLAGSEFARREDVAYIQLLSADSDLACLMHHCSQ